MELSRSEKASQAVTRVAGAGAGGLLVAIAGPEFGAAASAALTEVGIAGLEHWGSRVRRHVGDALNRAAVITRAKMADGEELRDDLSESEIAALKQAAIEAAAQSNEDRKAAVIANAYGAIAFDSTISIDDALLFLGRIRDASWRQLTVVQYLLDEDRTEERERIARRDEQRNTTEPRRRPVGLLAELSALGATLELIGTGVPGGTAQNPTNVFGGAQITSTSFADMTPTPLGRRIADLGDLASLVGKTELDHLSAELAEVPKPR